jgi:hypothetical protein
VDAMRLITEDLPESWIKPLLAHNVRYVEQFLAILQEPDAANNLAQALDCSLEALQEVAARVLNEHPEITVPSRSGATFSLGLGKRRDWK